MLSIGYLDTWFNTFCIDNFGAEKDSLVYSAFGSTNQFVASGCWKYESQNSIALSFETQLPSKASVVYETTTSYGDTTDFEERFFYLHQCHLRDLQPSTTYHYKFIAYDERGNLLQSIDPTASTKTDPSAIYSFFNRDFLVGYARVSKFEKSSS